jgi:ATP synthase protein I
MKNQGENNSNSKKSENNNSSGWTQYLGLGTELAATVGVMTYIGVWLDGKFKTDPIFTIICSFLGIAGGLYNFIKTVLKTDK